MLVRIRASIMVSRVRVKVRVRVRVGGHLEETGGEALKTSCDTVDAGNAGETR